MFHALGYHNFRVNIQKSGRELDLRGDHRTEGRQALAECKATVEPVGGSDVNKFIGALDAERRNPLVTNELTGYFVSLSGFRSTALEQEDAFEHPRVILVDAKLIERELVGGRIVVSPEVAAECAGRAAGRQEDPGLVLHGTPELLAWEGGWVWCVYFGRGGDTSDFALIHADGQLLGSASAARVVEADAGTGGRLAGLRSLALSDATDEAGGPEIELVRDAYLEFVGSRVWLNNGRSVALRTRSWGPSGSFLSSSMSRYILCPPPSPSTRSERRPIRLTPGMVGRRRPTTDSRAIRMGSGSVRPSVCPSARYCPDASALLCLGPRMREVHSPEEVGCAAPTPSGSDWSRSKTVYLKWSLFLWSSAAARWGTPRSVLSARSSSAYQVGESSTRWATHSRNSLRAR